MILESVLAEPPALPKSAEQIRKEAFVGYWRATEADPRDVAKAAGVSRATLFRWGREIRPLVKLQAGANP